GGVAESVFIAGLFVIAANELAAIAGHRGDVPECERLRAAAAGMIAAVDSHGWDGDWFRRAYDFFGEPIGSAMNEEGKIFIEPQGICIMAGIGLDDGRAVRALAAVRERLATPHGIVLQQPSFTDYQLRLGEISSYPPGYKENGGIFCHTNPWLMIAEALVGNPEGALDYYLRINPSAREAISEIHRCEPYVYAQMIAGPDAPTHGEAKNSWLTGTAAWNYVAATQWIVGVRPELEGLRIDPHLPADWGEIRVTRRFRGATYRIVVRRERATDVGPSSATRLVVDGRPIDGSLAPLPAIPGAEIHVEAILGGPPG
ncbi:MAG: GH36-type glycosyl hydrolase domain-containing protein, partial [Candidatus Limnocylindrales bacterium]